MAIQLIPALILAVGILFVPESPRWLISRNRDEAARRALVSLRQRPEDSKEVQMEYLQILGEHKFQQELGALEKGSESDGFISSAWNQWTYLFRSAANRKRVLVGVALMFFQCVSRC
jgi:hypothetical protein